MCAPDVQVGPATAKRSVGGEAAGPSASTAAPRPHSVGNLGGPARRASSMHEAAPSAATSGGVAFTVSIGGGTAGSGAPPGRRTLASAGRRLGNSTAM